MPQNFRVSAVSGQVRTAKFVTAGITVIAQGCISSKGTLAAAVQKTSYKAQNRCRESGFTNIFLIYTDHSQKDSRHIIYNSVA